MVPGINRVNNFLVAAAAGFLGHLAIGRLNPKWVGKITAGKRYRVPKSILCFCPVLADSGMWSVAIIADSHRTMTGFCPCIKMLLHNVAIGTCRRVVGKIGPALGVDKRVGGNPNNQPANPANNHPSKLRSTEPHDFWKWLVVPDTDTQQPFYPLPLQEYAVEAVGKNDKCQDRTEKF
ncbi:MAG: hypothetical protein UZ07_CHB004002163 [Chlorobi bacterium OLB7]|nr:MAG: hypothetical protein UZ07_CHB004002163 [Chlorobi bacterium OLB7]